MKSAKNSATIKMLALPALVRSCFEARSAAAGCAIFLATAGAAYAQQAAPAAAPPPADDTQLEAITVMGTYERSLVDSMDTKRNATSIVEAVSAEDIGKLPDSSIAEAISRLPGLAGQRVDGRQNSISVRGFGEDFSATTFNGREQVSISDNRSVEFDVYPSEIMSGVTVYKTPDAAMMTQGIAGTIDLRSVRPLEAKKSLVVSADYEKNSFGKLSDGAKDSGARGTVSYVDKFADNKLGVALALSVMDSPNQEERWQTWGYATDSAGNAVLGGAKPFVRSSELKRNTFMGVVEFAPVSGLKVTGDALYIDYKDDKILKGIEIPGAYAGNYTDSNIVNGFANSGVFNARDVQVRNDFEKQDAKLKALGLNAKYELDKDWTLDGDASWGQVHRDIFSLESYSGLGRPSLVGGCHPLPPGDNIGFNMSGGNNGASFTHGINYADPNLIHLGGAQCWGNGVTVPANAQDGFINFPHIDDTIKTLKLSAETAVSGSFVNNVEVGINYTDRTKAKQDHGVFLTLPNYPGVDAVPAGFGQSATSLAFIGMGNMLSYDSYALWKSGYYKSTSENLTVSDRSLNTWSVDEKVTTVFGKADIESQFFGLPLTGNFGLQVVQTHQNSDGFAATTNPSTQLVVATPVSGGATYTKVLPSINLILKTAADQDARFSVARTMSRSRMDRENASYGTTYNAAQGVGGGNFSNTALKPQLSDQIDLGYSWYYRKDAFVSAAAFYKHLTDWQVQSFAAVDFGGLPDQNGVPLPAGTPGYVTQWVNSSKGGFVRGVEFQGLLPGAAFSPLLDGFGLTGSASFLSSAVSVPVKKDFTSPTFEIPITVPGLSHNIYNLTAYYEKHGFGIRFSGSQRSDFLGEEPGTSFKPAYYIVKQTRTVDAQVSYSFVESGLDRLKGLTITFQVQNLTNEPFITYINPNDGRTVHDHQNYGRDYLLGFRYKF